jgi:hypothetical protein
MVTDATPGQSAASFLGGTGDVFIGRDSDLRGTLPMIGITAAKMDMFDGPNRDPMKPGMAIDDIFGAQKVTVIARPSSGLLNLFDSILDIDQKKETTPGQTNKGPIQTMQAAKPDAPKN